MSGENQIVFSVLFHFIIHCCTYFQGFPSARRYRL